MLLDDGYQIQAAVGIRNIQRCGKYVHAVSVEVFVTTFNHRAVQIVLIHNHPSGDAAPSPEARDVTAKAASTGICSAFRLWITLLSEIKCYTSMLETHAELFERVNGSPYTI